MGSLETPHIDLECGRRRSSAVESEEGSVCFSDGDEGSCNSQFYSTAGDGSYDDYSSEINLENNGDLRDDSSLLSDCSVVDIEENNVGDDQKKLNNLDKENVDDDERDCRICHLSLVSSSPGCGVAIELGCCCKDDLAAAHNHCAETWFKIKGNKTCEICNSLARNVVGPNDIEAIQQGNEGSIVASTTSSVPAAASNTETRSCLNGHRFLNFLLACMVFAFVISWLFHFNIPS